MTACFFGDGAGAEGEFHESMNLASLGRLPVLFCCENNLYAMGMALERAEAIVHAELKRGVSGLATIGSTAPFVGLFATQVTEI